MRASISYRAECGQLNQGSGDRRVKACGALKGGATGVVKKFSAMPAMALTASLPKIVLVLVIDLCPWLGGGGVDRGGRTDESQGGEG